MQEILVIFSIFFRLLNMNIDIVRQLAKTLHFFCAKFQKMLSKFGGLSFAALQVPMVRIVSDKRGGFFNSIFASGSKESSIFFTQG